MKTFYDKYTTKQEMKRNELAEWINKAVLWIRTHKEASMGIGFISLVAALLAAYFIVQYTSLKNVSWERLAVAQSQAYAGQAQNSLDQLRELADRFGQTDAAGFGILFRGDIYYKTKTYKEAAKAYQQVLDNKSPKSVVPIAMACLASSLESDGNYPAAMETCRKFLETYGDHYLAPQVHLELARCLEATQNLEAKPTYEKVVFLYPETYWASQAKSRLSELSTK